MGLDRGGLGGERRVLGDGGDGKGGEGKGKSETAHSGSTIGKWCNLPALASGARAATILGFVTPDRATFGWPKKTLDPGSRPG